MKMLEVQDIRYGTILNQVNFDWHQGEIIALMGTNGSGKTTLARLLTGLIEPEGGEIRLIDGKPCAWNQVKRWQEIGLVGQHPRRQTIGATVAEELGFGLLNLGIELQQVQNKVQELAVSIGLEGQMNKSPATLSGGERQRLVTVALLALQPAFLILDEALTMLDACSQEKVLDLLRQARSETGQLWITHDLELAHQADRLLVLEDGKIIDLGKPQGAVLPHGLCSHFGSQTPKDRTFPVTQKNSTPSRQPVLEWRQARYDSRFRLNNAVGAGEFIGIVGPTGSGKTTLLESAMGLILPSEGDFLVCGERMTKANLNSLRTKTRIVLQEAGEYLIGSSVLHEIFYGEPRRERRLKTQAKLTLLEEFGLSESLADVAPERLSGGERQKVALAAALRTQPQILFLDEPLLGLDPPSRAGVKTMISARQDLTILYVTHDLREVLEDADRLWLVVNGEVVLDCKTHSWQEHKAQFLAAGVRC